MSTTQKERYEVLHRLDRLGIGYEDANTLRRISMTLHRWYELECGDGNDWASWCVERDETTGLPYRVVYAHNDKARRTRIPDRERGAERRLKGIMERYPALLSYIQTDPRGASLYILYQTDLIDHAGNALPIESHYSRGIAVY